MLVGCLAAAAAPDAAAFFFAAVLAPAPTFGLYFAGSMISPGFVMIAGLVFCWKLATVFHSLPNGVANERSYCSMDVNG